MRRYLLLLLLVAITTSVPQLTSSNFIDTLTNNELVFVKFYSPTCPYCYAIASQIQALHQQAQNKSYKIFQIDCSEEKQLCVHNKVHAYPTLQLIVSGVSFQYEGKRTAQSISSWIQGLLHNSLPSLTAEEVKKKIGEQTFVVVSNLGQKSNRIVSIATKLYDYGIQYYVVQSNAFIGLYKKGSKKPQEYYTDENFPQSLVEWAFIKTKSALTQLNSQTLKYAKSQKQFQYLLVFLDQGDGFYNLSMITEWCSKNIKSVFCLKAHKHNSLYSEVSQKCKANNQKSTLAIVKNTFQQGYHYPNEELTQQKLSQFYQNAKKDKIERTIDLKRDQLAQFDFDNVVRLTQQTHNPTIKANKYALIFYFVPSSKYCLYFAPTFGKVGDHFKAIGSDIFVGSIESNAEDKLSKSLGIKNYPHVRFYIDGNSIIYSRQMKQQSIINFVTEISTAQIQKVDCPCSIQAKTFVLIRGFDQNTHLRALSVLFKDHPIYCIPQGEFSIEFHHKIVSNYKGKDNFADIVEWLQIESLPVLVSLGQTEPNKKLKKGLIDRVPILTLLNKHERSSVTSILDTLTEYCLGKQFICGYVHKDEPDYDMLNEWIGDNKNPNTGLYWISQNTLKYKYEGEVSQLTGDKLQRFVKQVTSGKMPTIGQKKKADNSSEQQL